MVEGVTQRREEAHTINGAHKGQAAYGALRFLVLVLALVVPLFTGCGTEAGSTQGTASQTAEQGSERTEEKNAARAAAEEIQESSIRERLAHLTGAAPAPLERGAVTIEDRGNEEGRRAAAEYMKESFEEAGVPARILEFTTRDRRGFNVEATLWGKSGEKHLWVTAHLDSFYNPGASDDGSGLVSILSIAEALKKLEPEHTVHFVAYDLEEVGLVGSTVYVGSVVSEVRQREGVEAIIGNLHTDMIGYDVGGYKAIVGTCDRAGAIGEAVFSAAEEIESPVNLSEDCLRRSDHEHFWDAGLPALVMTDGSRYDAYPWYHDPGDTMDKLDIPYLRSMIQLNTAAAALLVASDDSRGT